MSLKGSCHVPWDDSGTLFPLTEVPMLTGTHPERATTHALHTRFDVTVGAAHDDSEVRIMMINGN